MDKHISAARLAQQQTRSSIVKKTDVAQGHRSSAPEKEAQGVVLENSIASIEKTEDQRADQRTYQHALQPHFYNAHWSVLSYARDDLD